MSTNSSGALRKPVLNKAHYNIHTKKKNEQETKDVLDNSSSTFAKRSIIASELLLFRQPLFLIFQSPMFSPCFILLDYIFLAY